MHLFFSPTSFYSLYLRVQQSRGCPHPIISCMELKCWWTQRNVLNWSSWLLLSKDGHCWKNWCLQQVSILHLIVQVIKKDPVWVPLICRDLDIAFYGFLGWGKSDFLLNLKWLHMNKIKTLTTNRGEYKDLIGLANSLKLEMSGVYGWFSEHATHSQLKKDCWKEILPNYRKTAMFACFSMYVM